MSIDRRIYSFQYRLISCYVLLLISLAVYAQSGKERFVGRVVDTETNQPVPFATVHGEFKITALSEKERRVVECTVMGEAGAETYRFLSC